MGKEVWSHFLKIKLNSIPSFEGLDLKSLDSSDRRTNSASSLQSTPRLPSPCLSASTRIGSPLKKPQRETSQNSILPTLPVAAEGDKPPVHQTASPRRSSKLTRDSFKDNQQGRLLCCLKVEIKNGIYKMLPVHEVFFH